MALKIWKRYFLFCYDDRLEILSRITSIRCTFFLIDFIEYRNFCVFLKKLSFHGAWICKIWENHRAIDVSYLPKQEISPKFGALLSLRIPEWIIEYLHLVLNKAFHEFLLCFGRGKVDMIFREVIIILPSRVIKIIILLLIYV